jgi:hypothetical protein
MLRRSLPVNQSVIQSVSESMSPSVYPVPQYTEFPPSPHMAGCDFLVYVSRRYLYTKYLIFELSVMVIFLRPWSKRNMK